MANIFAEGFAQYPDGQPFGNNGIWLINEIGSQSNDRIEITSDSFGKYLKYNGGFINGVGSNYNQQLRTIVPNSNDLYIGYAVIYSGFTASGNGNPRAGLKIQGDTAHLTVSAQPDTGRLEISRNGTFVFTSAGAIFAPGVRAYIQVHVTPTSIEVYSGSNLVANISVSDIGTISYIGWGIFKVNNINSTNPQFSETTFTDIYVNNSVGAAPLNGYLGEISVFTLFPNADLSPDDWTVVGAASGWEALENVPPEPSEYIESGTVGDLSAFDLTDLTGAFQIFNVRAVLYGDKSSSGTCDVRMTLDQNGSTVTGSDKSLQENTPQYYVSSFPIDPDTGMPWNPLTFDPHLILERVL